MRDPSVWLCFNCEECSSTCPVNAKPGRVMAGIRQMAVEYYATPRWPARFLHQPGQHILAWLGAALLLLAAVAVGGSFRPQTGLVRLASMLPHRTVNIFFCAVAGLALFGMLQGAARAWKAFLGNALPTDLRRLLGAGCAAAREISTQTKVAECRQFPLSRWAHLAVMYGFLALLALAGLAVVLILTGAAYPMAAWHPYKIVANLAALFLILGTLYFLVQRLRNSRRGDASSWFDWALLIDLLLVGITGVLTEIFRFANNARLAYPAYFVHLVAVLVLLAGVPYSKLAHVVYRALALTACEYEGKRG